MRLIDAESSELQRKLKFIREAEYQIYGSGSWGFTAKCEHAIEDAPTVHLEPHWIPVTERLPEKSVEVLTCDSVGGIEIRSLEASYDGMLYWESQEGECDRLSDAIAWMPLHEPYKEVTE